MSAASARVLMGVALAILAACARPPEKAPAGPQVRQYHDVAISPAGDKIASFEFIETEFSRPVMPGALVIRSAADGKILRTVKPCAACTFDEASWSPSGDRIAVVVTNDARGSAAIDVVDAANGKVTTLATVHGVAGQTRWSPDGRTVSALAVVGAHKKIGGTQPGARRVGEIGVAPDEQRIVTIPAEGGPMRLVSPADTWIYEYDWTPDGRGFAVTAAKGDGDNNWWVARLQGVDLATGALREIHAPEKQIDFPRVSPDGKSVAFIGGLMSDFLQVGGDVFLVPLGGGAAVNLTPGFKGTFTSLEWRGGRLLATAIVGGENQVIAIDPVSHKTETLWAAPVSINGGLYKISYSADGRAAAVTAQDFAHAPHLLAGPIGRMAQISHENDALPAVVRARSVGWKNLGQDVQGWLLEPLKASAGKQPMIVQIHGGPSSAAQPSYLWKGITRDLAAHGYWLFLPNPRGSYGQGEAFVRANVKDFGGADLKDIMAGIDAVEKVVPIDEARLGVWGHSYGGFMTMWTVTHSQRFKAAVAGAGIANWVSYYGQNGIDQWMVPFFGASMYDDPSVYLRLSPIASIRAAKTPTFMYVGERDVECPSAQSIEFWHALTAMGVPNSLVIYDGEGHGIRDPKHVRDVSARAIEWFDRYLGKPV